MARPQFESFQQIREPSFTNPYSEMAFKYANKVFDSVDKVLGTSKEEEAKRIASDIKNTEMLNNQAVKLYEADRQAKQDLFNVDKFNATNDYNNRSLAARITHNKSTEATNALSKEAYVNELNRKNKLLDVAKSNADIANGITATYAIDPESAYMALNALRKDPDSQSAYRASVKSIESVGGKIPKKYKETVTKSKFDDILTNPTIKDKEERYIAESIINTAKKNEGTVYGEDNKVTDPFHIPNLPVNDGLLKLY